MWRCDLDILFIIKKQSMLIPFIELVGEMKKCLLKVDRRIIVDGQSNVNASRRFMPEPMKKPPHVLKVLRQEMCVDKANPEELKELQKDLIRDRNNKIDSINWDRCTVEGRYHDVQSLEDGTTIPLGTNPITWEMEGDEKFARKNLRDILSFDELREMFPTFPLRALRKYRPSPRSRPGTALPPENTKLLNNEYPTVRSNDPRPSQFPQVEQHDSGSLLSANIQPPPLRHRDSSREYELPRIRKVPHVNKTMTFSLFQSHTRDEIPPFSRAVSEDEAAPVYEESDRDCSYIRSHGREFVTPTKDSSKRKEEPTDETFDYLFGDVTYPSPKSLARTEQRSKSTRDNFYDNITSSSQPQKSWKERSQGDQLSLPQDEIIKDTELRMSAGEGLPKLTRETELEENEPSPINEDEHKFQGRDSADEALEEFRMATHKRQQK